LAVYGTNDDTAIAFDPGVAFDRRCAGAEHAEAQLAANGTTPEHRVCRECLDETGCTPNPSRSRTNRPSDRTNVIRRHIGSRDCGQRRSAVKQGSQPQKGKDPHGDGDENDQRGRFAHEPPPAGRKHPEFPDRGKHHGRPAHREPEYTIVGAI
jgi:hypothetical protein